MLLARVTGISGFVIFVIVWGFAASLQFQSYRLIDQVTKEHRTHIKVLDWPHSAHTNILRSNILIAEQKGSLNKEHASQLIETALKYAIDMSPLSSRRWLKSAIYYKQQGNIAKSNQALLVAEKLGWNRVHLLRPVLSQYLTRGDRKAIYRVSRRMMYNNLNYIFGLYETLIQYITTEAFVENVLLEMVKYDQRPSLKYIELLLDGAYNKHKQHYSYLVEVIWNLINPELRHTFISDKLLHRLEHLGAWSLIAMMSYETSQLVYTENTVSLDYLDQDGRATGCWSLTEEPGLRLKQFKNDELLEDGLAIEFNNPLGKNNIKITCYLKTELKSKQIMTIKGMWEGEGTTNSPVFLQASVHGEGGVRGKSSYTINQQGEWPIEPFNFQFSITPKARFVKIRLFTKNSASSKGSILKMRISRLLLSTNG